MENNNVLEELYKSQTGKEPYESIELYGGFDSYVYTEEYVKWLENTIVELLRKEIK